jgi:hypothetical protein
MIVDLRIYTIKPGRVPEFVALYKEHGLAIQTRHLAKLVGWYTTIEGELNTVVHMWGFQSQADREARRANMAADPEWQAYLKKVAGLGLLEKMQNRIVVPTDFSPQPL